MAWKRHFFSKCILESHLNSVYLLQARWLWPELIWLFFCLSPVLFPSKRMQQIYFLRWHWKCSRYYCSTCKGEEETATAWSRVGNARPWGAHGGCSGMVLLVSASCCIHGIFPGSAPPGQSRVFGCDLFHQWQGKPCHLWDGFSFL